MKTREWTTTKLITSGSLGVLLLILQLIPAIINTIAPTRTFAGPFTSLAYTILIIIVLFAIDLFGAAMIMFFVYGVLAIPFNLLGTPGFILKIPIAIGAGLIADSMYLALKKSKLLVSLLVGGPVLYYFTIMVVFVSKIFNLPGFQLQAELVFTPIAVIFSIIMGATSGYIGYIIYNKIKNTAVVKRIQK